MFPGKVAIKLLTLVDKLPRVKGAADLLLREYTRENVIGDFSTSAAFRDTNGNVVIRMGMGSRPYFELQDMSGHWQRFRVDYTIGSKWQQGYATRLPDGRLQVIPIEYNTLQKAWINYW